MELKVGDMVKYQDKIVRVLQLDYKEIKLAGFGRLEKDTPNIELVESVTLPQLCDGDSVIVHDIPKIEKAYYGPNWMEEMDDYVNKVMRVSNPRKSSYSGDIVFIGGWTFQTYHLEKIKDYDII